MVKFEGDGRLVEAASGATCVFGDVETAAIGEGSKVTGRGGKVLGCRSEFRCYNWLYDIVVIIVETRCCSSLTNCSISPPPVELSLHAYKSSDAFFPTLGYLCG